MSVAPSGHPGPWTEEEYLALDDTSGRVELFDGSLHMTPAPTPRHQIISRRLANALDLAAEAAGLQVLEAVNVRLAPGRIPIPDLVVTGPINVDDPVIDAASVKLVCEIISPGNAATDTVLKMHYYAYAGIGWYLLVNQRTGLLQLHRRRGGHYVEHASAKPSEVLHLTEPVDVRIDPGALLPAN